MAIKHHLKWPGVTITMTYFRKKDIFQKDGYHAFFCEESFGTISTKDGSFYEFYHLKALNTVEQVNTSVFEKRGIFMSKTLIGGWGGGGAN